MFQDPTFWVLVSFVLFVALVFKKAKNAMGAEIQTYQESIVSRAVTIEQELNLARETYEAQQIQYHQIMDQIDEIQKHAKQEVANVKEFYHERSQQLASSQVTALEQRKIYIETRDAIDTRRELLDKTLARVVSVLTTQRPLPTSIETLQNILQQ